MLALHILYTTYENTRQLSQRPGNRKPSIDGTTEINITGTEPIAILGPVLNAELRGTVRAREIDLVSEPASQQRSPRRLRIPAHRHAWRDDLGFPDDIETPRSVITKQVGPQYLEFHLMNGPIGRGKVLK
jgi:hypothetical protein